MSCPRPAIPPLTPRAITATERSACPRGTAPAAAGNGVSRSGRPWTSH
jgi:hypothetical protein